MWLSARLLLLLLALGAVSPRPVELPAFNSAEEEWAFHLTRGRSDHCSLRGLPGHQFIRRVYGEAAAARNASCAGSVTLGGVMKGGSKRSQRGQYLDGEKTLCTDAAGGLAGLRPRGGGGSGGGGGGGGKGACVVYALG